MRRAVSVPIALALLAGACGGAGTAPGSASPGGAAATATATPAPAPVDLQVSYSNVIGDELPLWATKEGGLFEQQKLNVTLQNIASAQGVPALIAGQTQFAQVGGSETLSANAGGADLVVVAQITGVYPFVLEVSSDIKNTTDLKGKKVGVSSVGSSSDIATRVALRKLGLDPDKDVTIVAVGSSQQRTAALLAGAIQAVASQKLPSANTSVVVKRDYLNANRGVVQRYVDALFLGIKKVKSDRAFGVQVLKKYFQSTDDKAMGATYEFYALTVTPSQPVPRPEQFADAQTTLGATNAKVKDYDVTKMLDQSFTKSAIDRGLDK